MNKILLAIALSILLVCAAVLPFLLRKEEQEPELPQEEEEAPAEFTSQPVPPKREKREPEEREDTLYDPQGDPLAFRGALIQQVYSLDGDGYRYHPVTSRGMIEEIALLLEDYEPEYTPAENMVGFLIFTDQDKYVCYLDAERMDIDAVYSQLVDISEECNANAAGAVEWLVYMTPSNLSRVTFQGLCGEGYSIVKQAHLYQAEVTITDREELDSLSAFLTKMNVRPADRIYARGTVAPADKTSLWTMTMEFSTGVTYTLFGYNTELYISSTDMEEQIRYMCSDLETFRLRDFMMESENAMLINQDNVD